MDKPKDPEQIHLALTRHARPIHYQTEKDPASKEYPEITEQGVEQVRSRAKGDILNLIESAPEAAVIFIGGSSDQQRTKDTGRGYGDVLAEYAEAHPDKNLLVITKDQIDRQASERVGRDVSKDKLKDGFVPGQIARTVESIQEIIRQNPTKRIVIAYPLELKQLTYKYYDRWTDSQGKKTPYFNALLKKHNQDHDAAGLDWLMHQGRLEVKEGDETKVLQGPVPRDVAEEYYEGLLRLNQFAKKYAEGRPVVTIGIGHQWDEDALVTFLANNGKVDIHGFNRVSGDGTIATETEYMAATIDPKQDEVRVQYRGQEFIAKKPEDTNS